MKDNITNTIYLKKRQEIYHYILKNPGFHERKISYDLNIPRSTLRYHLKYLERKNIIICKNGKKYNRYFISNRIGRYEKDILSCLVKEVSRNIILHLLYHHLASRKELSEEFEKSPSTLAFHIEELKNKKIIKKIERKNGIYEVGKNKIPAYRDKIKNEIKYELVDPDKIWEVLITYKNSKYEKLIVDLIWEIKEYHHENDGKMPDVYFPYRIIIDKISKKLYEVFPHPYHI